MNQKIKADESLAAETTDLLYNFNGPYHYAYEPVRNYPFRGFYVTFDPPTILRPLKT